MVAVLGGARFWWCLADIFSLGCTVDVASSNSATLLLKFLRLVLHFHMLVKAVAVDRTMQFALSES